MWMHSLPSTADGSSLLPQDDGQLIPLAPEASKATPSPLESPRFSCRPGEGAERPTAESGGTQPFRIPSLYSSELWSPRPVEIPASQPEGKTQPPTTLNTPASPRNDTNGLPVVEHGR